jgi:hypothetical protein
MHNQRSTSHHALAACLGILLAISLPGSASAASGRIEATWGSFCSPIVTNIESPAAAPLTLVASVIGNDETHVSYWFQFVLEGPSGAMPDAWRFDAGGCQTVLGALVTMNHLPTGAMSKTCPPFQGTGSSIQIKHYGPVGPSPIFWPATAISVVLANTYPAGNTTLASQRYHLATIVFDHTSSISGPTTPGVNCGGLDQPLLLHFTEPTGQVREILSSYVRMSGEEFPFDGWNMPPMTVNGSLPARVSTWGHIKGAYRR